MAEPTPLAAATRRIAMWSGPRNISTALMRSWEARGDTAVMDEPFYAHYLAATGIDHPDRDAIIRDGETDWRRVAETLTGPAPDGAAVFYQKHMAHHLLPEMIDVWLADLTHAFLIRHPAEMLRSLARVLAAPSLEDTGLPQQVRLRDHVARTFSQPAPIVDARDVLANPGRVLSMLCSELDVPYTDSMLSWRPGLRPTDGIWARHWYDQVAASTGFGPPSPPVTSVPHELQDLFDACLPLYHELHDQRLTP